MASWAPDELTLLLLLASVASIVITVVILADGGRRYAYASLAGLLGGQLGGILLRGTPTGKFIAAHATEVYPLTDPPILGLFLALGLLFALGLTLVVDALLSSDLPLFKRIRPNSRRALRPSIWGTAEEIAERAGTPVFLVHFLGLGVPARRMDAHRILTRVRITANVVCGSCVLLFVAIPGFLSAFLDSLKPGHGHILITLVGTAFVTFFLGPLHEVVLRLFDMAPTHAEPPIHSEKGTGRRQLAVWIVQFVITAILLTVLQAVHTATHKQIECMSLDAWILLLELCALPLLVTTYYFGAALHRAELGEDRWLRAFQASAWVGTIVLVPYSVVVLLPGNFSPGFRAQLVTAVLSPGPGSLQTVALGLIVAIVVVLLATALAGLCSLATYGVYAMGLAVAMTYATPSNARLLGGGAIISAGVIVQGITSGVVWWWDVKVHALNYVHLLLAFGWALGLFVSRFELEMRDERSAVSP